MCSRHCTTFSVSHQPRGKILSSWLEQKHFPCHSVVTDGLRTNRLLRELWKCGLTLQPTSGKPKSQVPTSNTFKIVNSAVLDPLLRAKLALSASTAGLMQPYLQVFQSDAPLLPFVTSDLQQLLEILMRKFVKQGELEKAGTAFKLVKLDVTQPSAQVAPQDADVGFAAKASLEKLLKEKKISDLQALQCIALQCWPQL